MPSTSSKTYKRLVGSLYDSKVPGRKMTLAMMPNIDLPVVYLVRNIHALVWASSNSWHQDLCHGIEGDVSDKPNPRFHLNWLRKTCCHPVYSVNPRKTSPFVSSMKTLRPIHVPTCGGSAKYRRWMYVDITYAIEDGCPLEVMLHGKTK